MTVPGKIIQVNISPGGVPKKPVFEGRLTVEGFEGDSWRHPEFHGGPLQAVLMVSMETLNELKSMGFAVFAGALGENLTTEGLDYTALRPGIRLRAGETLLEITKVRTPCDTLSVFGYGIQGEIYDARVKQGDLASPRWGRSGFYAKVIETGTVRPNDIITVEP